MKPVRVSQRGFIYHKTMNKNIKDIMVLLIALLLTIVVIAGIYYGMKSTQGTMEYHHPQGEPGYPVM